MSWVSLTSEAEESGNNSYKEVAKQAFASPTNLSSRLVGNRTPHRDGLRLDSSNSFSSRRVPSRISSKEDADTFQQMLHSTAVKVPKPQRQQNKSSSSNLGEGLKSLANRVSRQYHADLGSTDTSQNGSVSTGKESFSLGSVSRRTKDLDLAHNDNSFHVIGGLIVEFFHSKQKSGNGDLRLTHQDIAQLDRLAPPRVRASFVEAVRYRFTNSPMDSTNSVHMLARQCHDLGLGAEGPQNPLLVAAEAEIVIPVPNGNKNAASSCAPGSGASSHASDSDPFESIARSGSGPSDLSAHENHAIQTNASEERSSLSSHENHATQTNASEGRPSAVPLEAVANFLPPRQCGEDPPASISSHLTKLGVEVPYSSENGSVGNGSAAAASDNRSQATGFGQDAVATSIQGAVMSSLSQFGIEMPEYEETAAPIVAGEGSLLSDMKSMSTSLTKLGVEMPLQQGSEYASSAHSQEGASCSSGPKSQASQASSELSRAQSSKEQILVETVTTDLPVMSMSRTDESSVLPNGSSRDGFSNSEGLAKQQLLAELREAQNLMAESKTQEAAKFWRDHVLELESRLAALSEDERSFASGTEKHSHQSVDKSQSWPGEDVVFAAQRPAPVPELGNMSAADNHYMRQSANNDYQSNGSPVSGVQQDHDAGGGARSTLMIDPSLEGVPMVDVVAPADLPGGYHFEAEIEGRRFLATVPAGGVQKGETFSCYMRDLEKVGSDIPVGRWRDGLFDCCSIGCCHPVICNALFCPLVLLAQIMTRVGFDFLGRPSVDNSVNGPSTLWTILSFWVFVNLVLFSAYNVKWSRGIELSMADLGALAFVNVAYTLFMIYVTSATRGSLREKYYIRESRFHDLEDCCCATFCMPCSVCQMARHTADYDEYEGVCCNETGLPDVYETSSPKQSNSYIV